ncbi:MAG: DUF937 domain-containing protein [Rhizobiales bacterium]|nr:DUF937 domain-containing protein [Hyphomicrobiales bacterium]MBI3672141.1 DUF937 domain-containing protein [Hyphomicrobiales bacterium]
MALMRLLAEAQGGGLFGAVGQATGLDGSATQAAMTALCPAIAGQLQQKSTADPATFESLLDLLEEGADGSVLDDATELTDAEAVADGNAILDDIYGSRDAAIRAMRQLAPEVPETSLGRLAAISAVAVLGALAKTQAPMALADAPQAASSSGGGLFGSIVSAIVKGVVQEAARELAPKRRRRRYGGYFGRRTTRRTRRRRATPSLDDIFRDILGATRG